MARIWLGEEVEKGIKQLCRRRTVQEIGETIERNAMSRGTTLTLYRLRNFATGLRAYLESDNWSFGDKEELILVYSAWG